MTSQQKGKVIIAGAGPGDADLITVKLQQRLAEADVIVMDRLVNPEIIDLYAKENALVLTTGKKGYHEGSTPQSDINQLLVTYAGKGKTVLRLKGGDVAFFSNVLDELNSLSDAGIAYEIIPGISAASGISAYTGIPLTARGYAKGVQFVTFSPGSFHSRDKWKAWASTSDTLVFYMAAGTIHHLTELLLKHSKNPATPMAVIEQATTAFQKVHISTVHNCAVDFAGKTFSSPSMVIIGEVVRLHEKFQWYKAGKTGSVFNELITVQQPSSVC